MSKARTILSTYLSFASGLFVLAVAMLCAVPFASTQAFELRVSPSVSAQEDAAIVDIFWDGIDAPDLTVSEGETVLRFNAPLVSGSFQDLPEALPDWIAFVVEGFDAALIATPRTVRMRAEQQPSGVRLVLSKMETPTRSRRMADANPEAQRMRLVLLRAELDRRAGRLVEARRSLRAEMERDPQNYDVLVTLAGLELGLERPEKAVFLYNRALSVRPGDENARAGKLLALNALNNTGTSSEDIIVSTRGRYQKVRDADRQYQTATEASAPLTDQITAVISTEERQIKATDIRQADGSLANINSWKYRASAGLRGEDDEGRIFEGRTYVAENVWGFGASVSMPVVETDAGEDRLQAEIIVNEPYWGFVETIAADGSRSRLRSVYNHRLSEGLSAYGGASVNRYGVEDDRSVADTVGVEAGFSYKPEPGPGGLSLLYGVDGEYLLSRDDRVAADGSLYNPVPIVLRETHAVRLFYDVPVNDSINLLSYAGYAYDRYNGKGPAFGLSVTYAPSEDFRVNLRGDHNITSGRGSDSVVQSLGADLQWRY